MSILAPEEMRRLSARERLDLIEQLWDSLDERDIPLTSAQQAELARRVAVLDEAPHDVITWEQLKAKLSMRQP